MKIKNKNYLLVVSYENNALKILNGNDYLLSQKLSGNYVLLYQRRYASY